MITLLYIYIFFIGAALGSFALVVAERWGTKRSWVSGRSQCDSCKRQLSSVDLIPIFSWIFSSGTCRYCKKSISAKYPLVEILSGLVLLAVFIGFPYEVDMYSIGFVLFLLWILIHTILVALVCIDAKKMIMPYKFLFPLIALSIVFRALIMVVDKSYSSSIASLILAVVIGGGIFAVMWYISRGKWIGDSDILLGVAIAFIVGGIVEVWIAFVSASTVGLVYGLLLTKIKHKKIKNMKIPFGPFLVLGMIVSLLFSASIIDFYLYSFLPY